MKKDRPTKNGYTVTEVGTMLENIHDEIKIIAEGHAGLDQRLEKVEIAVHGNSRRLDSLELGFTVLDGKVTRLEDAVSLVSKEIRETREELGSKIDHLDKRLMAVENHR